MRWVRSLVLFCTLVPLAALALDRGEPAPDFDLPGAAGIVHLRDYRGKVVYLDFWASWCVPCRQSFPWMNDMQARYRDKGLAVLAINADSRAADAARFLQQVPARFDIAYDTTGDVSRSYAVRAMPTSLLIDRAGRILDVHRGFTPEDTTERERRIREALGLR
jgi:cytochrome c biogenesis protein CcmG/thiol:disulfide interchange protein DsbE